MSTQSSTSKYIELSSRTYGLIVDTFASATRGRLDYWKSVWEVASRPYFSTAIGSARRENFNRVSELANLTISELHSRGQRTVDFSGKFLAEIGKLQDSARETYRYSLKSNGLTADQVKGAAAELSVDGVSTVDQVKETATEFSVNGFNHGETAANLVSVSN